MSSVIKTWLDFAMQQLAAEAYLDQALSGRRSLVEVLRNGTNNADAISEVDFAGATRFVSIASDAIVPGTAEAFEQRFLITDHRANDASGFSATLFEDTENGSYTLSFRSTEYRDQDEGGDFQRDGSPFVIPSPGIGAGGEIAEHGFALGQLLAMEEYYQYLVSSGKLSADDTLNVTGYSLGGHLATVFTELHFVDIEHAYTFNSPGRGAFENIERLEGLEALQIKNMLQRLREVMFDPSAGQSVLAVHSIDLRYVVVYNLAVSLAASNTEWNPFLEGSESNLYLDYRYQWARLVVADEFSPSNTIVDNLLPGAKPRTDGAFAKITQIVGTAARNDTEYVANSQEHPTPQAVFIEDQPDFARDIYGVGPMQLPDSNRCSRHISASQALGSPFLVLKTAL